MENQMDQKLNLLVVPISWVVAAIVAIVIGVCGYDWVYYLIGVFTGLLNFGLMIKANRRMVRAAKENPEAAAIYAKKQAWLGMGLRILVFTGVFVGIFFKEVYGHSGESRVWNLVIAFGGYATIKFVLVAVYLVGYIIGKKVGKE
ncbi:MAG: hypothetical protein K2H02_02205 [Anaeroplasmataceae bacterium]|nr:hypothetical protein [Anaeroplasmataceae bacterium]